MDGYLITFALGAAFVAGVLLGRRFERMEVIAEKAHVPPRPLPPPAPVSDGANRRVDERKAA